MVRVSRRPKVSKRRSVDGKRRREAQGRVQRRIKEAIARLVEGAIEEALQGEVTELLNRAKGERRDLGDLTMVEASCNRCKTHYRGRFYRGGFYPRGLLTFDAWGQIQVPRVRCLCGGMVDLEFVHLVPYGRLWFDLEERARELAGLCVSLRDGVEILSWGNGEALSIGTLNRMVNRAGELARAFRSGPLDRVPAVVMLDGVWLKLLEPTGEKYTDKKGRLRDRLKMRKFPLLVWPMGWTQSAGRDGFWTGRRVRMKTWRVGGRCS